ncbi:unnamed protein product [Arabidopsis halleri]
MSVQQFNTVAYRVATETIRFFNLRVPPFTTSCRVSGEELPSNVEALPGRVVRRRRLRKFQRDLLFCIALYHFVSQSGDDCFVLLCSQITRRTRKSVWSRLFMSLTWRSMRWLS